MTDKKTTKNTTGKTGVAATKCVSDPTKVHYLTPAEQKAKEQELLDCQADPEYRITLTFLHDGLGWFADVPNHTRGQNSMVAGADVLIDKMAHGDNRVDVTFRTVEPKKFDAKKPILWLKRFAHHSGGAEYLVHGVTAIPFPAFLCDVTHDLTGEHPKYIGVYGIMHSHDERFPKRA